MRDEYSKKFAAYLTMFGCAYIMLYSFLPYKSQDAREILIFILGTIMSTSVNWAIGTSKTSSDKTEIAEKDKQLLQEDKK